MADRDTWRDAPLSGDTLYGDRENLRRYRDNARDEHRRFWSQYEREQQGGLPRQDALIEYDRFDVDLTRGDGAANAPRPQQTNRGRGPRGYQRSDERIREDVCERLTDDAHIDASEIDVSVSNGEVTLTGTLRSRNAKRRTTDVVEQVSGVKDVHNLIRVSDEQRRTVVRSI
jgi:osmotically-inducible protein OsmY